MLKKITSAAILVVALIFASIIWWSLNLSSEPEAMVADDERSANDVQAGELISVVLTPEKVASADIKTAAVAQMEMRTTRTIPGRLDYDQDFHVDIKTACDGILTRVLVHPGDHVSAGQIVAEIRSPDIDSAGSEVRSRLADLDLARSRKEWQQQICHGVEELASLVKAEKSPEEIESALQDDSLGEYREKIVTAYMRQRLSRSVAENSRSAASRGAIAASVQQQRESEWKSAMATLESVLEQSLFEVRQLCQQADAEFAQAERRLEISLQQLNGLLGPAAQPVTIAQMLEPAEAFETVNLISPLEGTVEERYFSANERVSAGASVLTVADCSRLWAVADVREGDWAAMSVSIGQPVRFTSPAIPNRTFNAEVYLVGRKVDPDTGAIPLIAAVSDVEATLRPGLFIRMTVPTSAARQVVAVPEQAVVVHEGQHFVFVAESEHVFRRVDVLPGETAEGFTELLDGPTPGEQVAVSGVFKLKSELLLAGEEE